MQTYIFIYHSTNVWVTTIYQVLLDQQFLIQSQRGSTANIDTPWGRWAGNTVVSDGLSQTAVTPFFFISRRQSRPGFYRSGRSWYKGNPFRSKPIQQLFLKRKKREMLLLAPMLTLRIQISREFGGSLIAPRKFSTEESYLQATVGVGFSDWEQDVEKNIKTKMWEIEGIGEGDMERRRKYTRRMKETIIAERINI